MGASPDFLQTPTNRPSPNSRALPNEVSVSNNSAIRSLFARVKYLARSVSSAGAARPLVLTYEQQEKGFATEVTERHREKNPRGRWFCRRVVRGDANQRNRRHPSPTLTRTTQRKGR